MKIFAFFSLEGNEERFTQRLSLFISSIFGLLAGITAGFYFAYYHNGTGLDIGAVLGLGGALFFACVVAYTILVLNIIDDAQFYAFELAWESFKWTFLGAFIGYETGVFLGTFMALIFKATTQAYF